MMSHNVTVMYFHFILFYFILNQQFITRHMVADRGSYFVTTYNRNRLHVEMEIEK